MRQIIHELAKLANSLDRRGLRKEADVVDKILASAADYSEETTLNIKTDIYHLKRYFQEIEYKLSGKEASVNWKFIKDRIDYLAEDLCDKLGTIAQEYPEE
jgi:hypothetical protein